MYAIVSFLAVVLLAILAYAGTAAVDLRYLFGVIIPYLAVFTFFAGVVYRILDWAKSPVPFRIPTTCGQEKSLPWIKQDKLGNPATPMQVVGRMLLEILLFRSLFRNTKLDYSADGPAVRYNSEKWLWLFGLLFHYSFLVVLLRHLRFFLEPVPGWVAGLEALDGFLEIGLPGVLLSGVVLAAAVGYLLQRRLTWPNIRYISLTSDYFPLWLILGIALTGIAMRYLIRVDVVKIKELTMGLVTFHPVAPLDLSPWFYAHLFLVSVLFAYFPFSKLVHAPGVFLSPTRNLANNSRAIRHVNPWNYEVKYHTYQAYEDEFRENMKEVGLPVEKD